MINKIKSLMLSLTAVLALALPMALPATVSAADLQGHLCRGADLQIDQNTANCDTAGTGNTLNDKIARFINIASAVIGVVAVFMIIFAGFRYITSGGAEKGVGDAKKTIQYALIGLIVVALAQLIVKFVIKSTTSV